MAEYCSTFELLIGGICPSLVHRAPRVWLAFAIDGGMGFVPSVSAIDNNPFPVVYRDAYATGKQRRGVAMVEFAVALPLLFLVIFGSIQACNAIFTQQFITEVSYQGAMAASRPNVVRSSVISEMQQLIDARGISSATYDLVGIGGTSFDLLVPGDVFKVVVTVAPSVNQSGPSVVSYSTLVAETFGRKQ
ncbi:MAG: pilus assembly protein [Planctomycetales bacterium]|nr:pilus assembly protein [Planctomycetales bacterium]